MSKILTFDCSVPGWCSFRIPHSINAHLTYPAPPPTTIYGLIANAMGLWQDDYSLMPQLKITLRILKSGSTVETFSKWKKWNPSKGSMDMTVVKQKIIQPAYRIFVSGKLPLLEEIHQALKNPKRLLYLGESDDLVELSNIRLQTFSNMESIVVDSALSCDRVEEAELLNHASVVHWPVRFAKESRSYSVEYELVYLAEQIQLSKAISCLRISETKDFISFEGEVKVAAS